MVRGRGRISLAPRVTIGALPNNVLLDIFQFCVPHFDPFLDSQPETWYNLVHICRRWRFVVFASPLRLDLHLLCTSSTPVREALDVWPPLPIKIWSGAGFGYLGDNIIAALEHPDRVREMWLFKIRSSLGRLITVMQKPFPALETLCLEVDETGQTVPTLANTFLGGSAPRLRSLTLNRIPFPTLPRLLLSSNDLSRLYLRNIPHSGYIFPEALVRAVSTLTGLTYLDIGFESPASCPDQRTRRLPPLTPAVLSALTTFKFHGVREYLEDLVAQIDAPLLEDVHITLFNQLIFDIRQLPRFIGHTSSFVSCNKAEMMFYSGHIVISLLSSMRTFLRLELRCRGVDWQVSSMAQICDQCSFLLSGIKQLDIRGHMDLLESTLQVDMDNTQWLELFYSFAAVQTLRISREFQLFIVSALRGLSGESVSAVLPALGDLHLERYQVSRSVSEKQDIKPFITARQRSGHPVSVHLWELERQVPKVIELPPLPTIKSRRILQRIFTHRSLFRRPKRAFEDSPNDPSPNNEQLVNLGDKVFGLVVTDLIRAHFPNLRVGPSSKLRDRLKLHVMLANIAASYGLPQSLLVQTSQVDEVRRSPHAQAEVFKAYVGGLFEDQGMEIVNSWLSSLFEQFIHQEYDHVRREYLIQLSKDRASETEPCASNPHAYHSFSI